MLDPALPRATRWTGWRNTSNGGQRTAVEQLCNNCAEPLQFRRRARSADQNTWLASLFNFQKATGFDTARQFIRISDEPGIGDHCVWKPCECVAFRFAWNEDQVVGRFHEVAKLSLCHVARIEIAMHQHLRCRKRTKQTGQLSTQPSWKSIDDEAVRRGLLNFCNRVSAPKFKRQLWAQNDKIQAWKNILDLPAHCRILKNPNPTPP